jgi:HAD superfamily hydrolase (TIGR01549 family)
MTDTAASQPTLIFDIDGTLVDSNDAHARAWVAAFADLGVDVPFERVRPLIGMGSDQLVPEVSGIGEDDPRFRALSDGWASHFRQALGQLRAFDGTRALVQAVQAAGWRTVVATSGEAELAGELLRLAQVDDLLTERVSSADVQASKPHPDLIQAALEKVGADPAGAWMLGDTHFDIEAAHRAGVHCAVVRLGGNAQLEQADRVFGTLAEVAADFTAPDRS